uniref:WW domain-containing protein n=1 Tax=Bubo bubo TaxID=30461 RepID=A0A8C0F4Z5_BUBBB
DPDLPPGWRKIHDSLGTYYWHVPTGTTQWQHPTRCFAVRSLGWVEIPEEDLAPGKSSIAVNNCIQQLSNSKGQGSTENWGEGQDLVMILKKDTMSLVDPLDHSLIHCQPILNIRVWGVGCNNGRCQGMGRARGWGVALPDEGGSHPSNNLSPLLPPRLPRRL